MNVKRDSRVLSARDVQHVARLARLTLTEEEVETYRQQLSAILQHATMLEQLDIDHIDPTASILPLCNVMREDQPGGSLSVSEALANAPARHDGFFKVQSILD
jgi:aspartyl-tRNA(Asn)/glutamyl-tRNA(Gln) amidotransferase subunit C